MRFPFFRNRDSVKNGILISIRRTGDGFHPGLFKIDITSKSSNKFRYQANRAFIIGRIKIIFPKILCDLSELPVIEKLYKEAVRCRSQILPGRSFPRKKLKSKGRSHFRNKKAAL